MTKARQLAFKQSEPHLGVLLILTPWEAFKSELDAIADLSRELIGAETMVVPSITINGETLSFDRPRARLAMESTAQCCRENYAPGEVNYKTRVHSRTGVAYRTGYIPEIVGATIHAMGTDANCELEETDLALVSSVGNLTLQETQTAKD